MEQSEILHTQVLQAEDIPTDNNVQIAHVTEVTNNHNTKIIKENDQDLSNICQSSVAIKSTLSMDNSNITVKSELKDHIDVNSSSESTEGIGSDTIKYIKPKAELDVIYGKHEIIKIADIGIHESLKDELIDSNHGSESLSIKEGQSLNVISESNIVETYEEAINVIKSDINTIEDPSQSHVHNQYPIINKSIKQHSDNQLHDDKSPKETVKNIHDNNSNQNNSVVTDAELTKLINEDTEVIVVAETVPATTADNLVVNLAEKNISKECNRQRENEFDIIDYNQEHDGAIIEVISTEAIHTPITEQSEKQNVKNCAKNDKYNVKSENITDEEIAIYRKKIDREFNTEISTLEKNDNPTTDLSQVGNPGKNNTIEGTSEADNISVDETLTDSQIKKRSVIQDIFDDWEVENNEEDTQSASKCHDSVEIELKSLLDEIRADQTVTDESVATTKRTISSTNKQYAADNVCSVVHTTEKNGTKKLAEQAKNQNKSKIINQNITLAFNKNEKDSSSSTVNKTSRNVDSAATTPQLHTTVPKNRSRHLTSQIASPAEVTEVLKERFREKQKSVEVPRGPDIFFVKKLTQRLSSKLAGGPVNPVPALIPLPQQSTQSTTNKCDKETSNTTMETNKDSSDNKELLAILEGDVDPDWSNLKPPILTEEGKISSNVEHSDHRSPPKLDPSVERELALKQLLELPVTTSKKSPSRKKKIFKSTSNKSSKDIDTEKSAIPQEQKEITNTNLAGKISQSKIENSETSTSEYISQKGQDIKQTQEIRLEESRSGRKRKLTEKAREHENTIKRQKIYKMKISVTKKPSHENNSNPDNSLMSENHIVTSNTPEIETLSNEQSNTEEIENKQTKVKVDTVVNKTEYSVLKSPKQGSTKKDSQSVTKKKMIAKKAVSNKNSIKLKTKLKPTSKKSKVIAKSQKRTAENITGDVKPKKKIINEIDRLLQDEGVVNLLYDVEQPDKKRLIPITKSRAKVMDLQKVQRELKIRKKLVRNAVLRLRTPTTEIKKVSPRSKRTAVHTGDIQIDKKTEQQSISSKSENVASPMEFILPAKMKNAADASVIVRRHSSSSLSSASGSPRVSIDATAELAKLDDEIPLRTIKRRHPQNEKINMKKSKKKIIRKSYNEIVGADSNVNINITNNTTNSNVTINNTKEKVTGAIRPNKKSEIRKTDKIAKYRENISAFEEISSSKVTTRSNGTNMGKVTAKNKKYPKSKGTVVTTSNLSNTEDFFKEEDELSACLAEAATALSTVTTSGSSSVTRKSKGKSFNISDNISDFTTLQ